MILKTVRGQKGFSMIEIMVVLVIIGALVATFSSRIGRSNRQIRKDVRYFAGMVRDIRVKARMKNLTYRLVITIPEDKEKPHNFWVESSSKPKLLSYDEETLARMQNPEDEEEEDEENKKPPEFQKEASFTKNGETLPEPLKFKSIEIASHEREYTSGRVFIHFFPEGRVEEAVIHIEATEDLEWSLATHPLTGHVDILAGNVKLQDLKQ